MSGIHDNRSSSDDSDPEDELDAYLGQLEDLTIGLGDTSPVKKREKTRITENLAVQSFRFSVIGGPGSGDGDVTDLDDLLGELCVLENQLSTTQHQLNKDINEHENVTKNATKDHRLSGEDDLTAALAELSGQLDSNESQFQSLLGSDSIEDVSDSHTDITDIASAKPKDIRVSEIYEEDFEAALAETTNVTKTGTTSQSTNFADKDHTSQSIKNTDDDFPTCSVKVSHGDQPSGPFLPHEPDSGFNEASFSSNRQKTPDKVEQRAAIMKAEKIQIAIEKIKEANIRKLFARIFTIDGSSKSILVDESMEVHTVILLLFEKNHLQPNINWAVIEKIPQLYMERVLEDDDNLVDCLANWVKSGKNQLNFERRDDKYDLFQKPENYLCVGSSSQCGTRMAEENRQELIQEFFSTEGTGMGVPEIAGLVWLKASGKKSWKEVYCVLRASGLYCNMKGKASKSPKDLVCLQQLDFVDIYYGVGWVKKYKAPTEYCFALKHPKIQKKADKYIKYMCVENQEMLQQWMTGIRIAKHGKLLMENHNRMKDAIFTWYTEGPPNINSTNLMPQTILPKINTQDTKRKSRIRDSGIHEPPQKDHDTPKIQGESNRLSVASSVSGYTSKSDSSTDSVVHTEQSKTGTLRSKSPQILTDENKYGTIGRSKKLTPNIPLSSELAKRVEKQIGSSCPKIDDNFTELPPPTPEHPVSSPRPPSHTLTIGEELKLKSKSPSSRGSPPLARKPGTSLTEGSPKSSPLPPRKPGSIKAKRVSGDSSLPMPPPPPGSAGQVPPLAPPAPPSGSGPVPPPPPPPPVGLPPPKVQLKTKGKQGPPPPPKRSAMVETIQSNQSFMSDLQKALTKRGAPAKEKSPTEQSSAVEKDKNLLKVPPPVKSKPASPRNSKPGSSRNSSPIPPVEVISDLPPPMTDLPPPPPPEMEQSNMASSEMDMNDLDLPPPPPELLTAPPQLEQTPTKAPKPPGTKPKPPPPKRSQHTALSGK
ncbi:unnamed protein product [Owenia fusiformis]|uniref:Uncharacterized protein n=1 Tax=Owenia fusiformis TaxID=6347 RepID=A0A8J1TSD8_OWEFU|nr:unnamed protein product [Owenia fusiformis]